MNLKRFLLMNLFLFFSTVAFSQTMSDAQQSSLSGNEVHDKLFYLVKQSKNVALSSNTVELLNSVTDSQDVADKMFVYRSSILKVLYNPAVSKEDKVFISEHYLGQNNDAITPIRALLQQHLVLNSN